MEFSTRQRLFNACDPDEALEFDDPRLVDLDGIGDPPARGASWIAAAAAPMTAKALPSRQIVTAAPGSGLSTELCRLARQLRDPGGANLLVAHADAARAIDLTRPLDIADVLLLLVGAAHDGLARTGRVAPSEVSRRMQRWLPELSGLAPGERLDWPRALAELRLASPFRERLRADVHAELSRFIADARDDLAASRDAARRLGRSGILVVVDSLEKLWGGLDERADVLASAERFFGADGERLELPVHTLYAAPPALLLRRRFAARVHVLPALRVFGRDGRPDEAGFSAARALVRARVSDDILTELLGATKREDRVRQMIERSAGLPRDLVKLLRRVVARQAIDEGIFDGLLGEVGETQGRLLLERSYPTLARVHADKSLPPEDEVGADDLGLALEVGAVLPYRDARGPWFDVVPAVRALCGVAEESARAHTRV